MTSVGCYAIGDTIGEVRTNEIKKEERIEYCILISFIVVFRVLSVKSKRVCTN
jgi:hypothetical protein